MHRIAKVAAVSALFVMGCQLESLRTVKAQSGQTITFTNTAQSTCGKAGQCWVYPNPVPSAGTIYYSPSGPNGAYVILFENTAPSVNAANGVHGVKTRLVQPTSVYNGCPIGALDKLEFTAQPVYSTIDGSFEYLLNAEQYIGNYYWSNGGGGRGGGSSGCYSHIMAAGTPLPDGTVTSGGFTSVTYPVTGQ
jgi:hypothetical protein